ncbi:unnamed protein product [Bursaphelenchus okinawaensis]|uniref:G-protein coupled receptors family 1 profile domain-containing protein n=1 Tax=Bursaphelenchus okinawaensis TaxID=465554 RepID=A0A811KYS1_9BILA|nr:unnamed protein product [Bursaphelenchus okinawaensis]CAG9114435.1 unnamed protein product [Bursaphelenchus okinawaensis]
MDSICPEIPSAILGICGVFGIFGNMNIIIASIRKKNLRSTCNYLIAILSVVDLFHGISQLILCYYVFRPQEYPTLYECIRVQTFSMFGCNGSEVMIWLISLDRLYSIARPIAYKSIKKSTEIFLCLLITSLISGSIVYIAYEDIELYLNEKTICSVASSYKKRGEQLFILVNAVFNILTLINYAAIWIVVKKLTKQRMDSMLRSICAVTVFGIGGWFVTFTILSSFLTMGIKTSESFVLYAGIACNVSLAVNYPIYFVMSNQYKQAFSEQLNIMAGRKIVKTSFNTVGTIHSRTNQPSDAR